MLRPDAIGRRLRAAGGILAMILPLAACGIFEDEDRLEGERIPVRRAQAEAEGPGVSLETVPLPPAQAISAWTQVNGNAAHNSGHLAGPSGLTEAWSRSAGTGTSDDSELTAAPIVAGGTVYTLDAAARVSAFDTGSGALRWRTSLVPNEEEDGEEGFGGGLALAGDRLYVTTGFGEVLALAAGSGEILWRQGFNAAFRAGPAIDAGILVAVTRNSEAFGLNPEDGKVVWRHQGVVAPAGFLGGASPAIAGGLAFVPYSSGELVAVSARTGRQAWGLAMTGGRRGLARAAITDLTGDPVVMGRIVISANQSGRIVAVDARTGRRVWSRALGAIEPAWPAGDTLFLMTDTARLMRLSLRDGTTLWSSDLPAFEDMEDREDPIAYSGPVVVSGRVLLTDSIGNIWAFDARTGEGGIAGDISGGSTTGPVVAENTIYILSEDAELHAYR